MAKQSLFYATVALIASEMDSITLYKAYEERVDFLKWHDLSKGDKARNRKIRDIYSAELKKRIRQMGRDEKG